MAKRPAAARPKPTIKKPEKSSGKTDVAKTKKAGAVTSKKDKINKPNIHKDIFARVYPRYIAKAKETGHTMEEVNQIITWLTGFKFEQIAGHLARRTDWKTFFAEAKLNPKRTLITGSIDGERVESIQDKLVRDIRYMDKLIDELAQGKAMDKILRK
mmetsp:Transcript_36264/g.86775  ORF Transcript_36264/g.86775 Transcript_36264/m.86775 type:complete len:157 (+) Transcript_36264:83-553(+)|eukprot:CAMPEP_0181460700 /NCGR_PEP_ID=MMETSP1110-20121109/33481_1 /TAXON_ID=174948 /ORGANISM="Symbiodinium sp., Strain CCMP421" /LENGTH=156 /DNA_ID=CAMNT_0023585269 /DNA_START=82 /DNA_END=552 /DNA_ORIENTATION=-